MTASTATCAGVIVVMATFLMVIVVICVAVSAVVPVVAQAIAVALVEDDARIPGEPTTWNVELMDLSEALVQYFFVPVACH